MSGPTFSTVLSLLHSQFFYHPSKSSASFDGQTVLVTGGNAGLGREAVKLLLQLDVERVIIACRTVKKGEATKQELLQLTGSQAAIDVWQLDMASFASVKAFGERLKTIPRLDAAIANAGTWPTAREEVEGFEETLTVNVISTMLLAHLVLPVLQKTADEYKTTTRLCFLGSVLHKFATLQARKDKTYTNILEALTAQPLSTASECDARYNDSKLLLQMYAQRLSQRYEEKHGKGVCITMVQPGYCRSGLRPPTALTEKVAERVMARPAEYGARIYIDAIDLSKASQRHGVIIDDCKPALPARWISTAEGRETTERLWKDMNELIERTSPGIIAL